MSTHTVTSDADARADHRPRSSVTTRIVAGLGVVAVLVAGVFVLGRVAPTETVAMMLTGVFFAAVLLAAGLLAWRRRDLTVPLAVGYGLSAVAAFALLVLPTLTDRQVDEQVVTGAPAAAVADTDTAAAAGGDPDAAAGDTDADSAAGAAAGDADGADDAAGAGDDSDTSDGAASGAGSDDGAGDGDAAQAPLGNVELVNGAFTALDHPGSGRAAVVELAEGGRVLTLTDFETDPGPDLRVYLTAGDPAAGEDIGEFVDLGVLKGNVGDQQYELPDDVDLDELSNVVVWCRAFSVGFTSAPLAPSA
jgi:hypothetical protein